MVLAEDCSGAAERAASVCLLRMSKTMTAESTLVVTRPGACIPAAVHASHEQASELSIPFSVMFDWPGALSATGDPELPCSSNSILLLLCCVVPHANSLSR